MKTGGIRDFMEITTRIGCPVNCDFCPQSLLIKEYKKRSDIQIMSLDDYKTMIDKLPKTLRIDFSGMAEPWANPNCTDMVLYTFNSGHWDIGIFTTGVGMSIEDVEKIKHIPFLKFVLHLPDKEKYSKIKVNDEYIKLIQAIKDANMLNFDTMTMGTPLDVFVEMFGTIKTSDMHSRAGNQDNTKADKRHIGPISCLGDIEPKRNELLPNGDVALCCNDYGLKHIIGNLLTNDYETMFTSDEFNKIKNGLIHNDKLDILCRQCIYTTPMKLKNEQIKDTHG